MKKINRRLSLGSNSRQDTTEPKSVPPMRSASLPSPTLSDLISADAHYYDKGLARRESEAHTALDRAATVGVYVNKPQSSSSLQTSVPKLLESIEIISRAAERRGGADKTLADPAQMRLKSPSTASPKIRNLIAMGNLLVQVDALMLGLQAIPASHDETDVSTDIAEKITRMAITTEVYTTTKAAAEKLPASSPSSIKEQLHRDMLPITNRLNELTATHLEKQEKEAFDTLVKRLDAIDSHQPDSTNAHLLKECAPYFLQLLESPSFPAEMKHTLAGFLSLRRSLVILTPENPQVHWTQWVASTDEGHKMSGGDTARIAMLRATLKGSNDVIKAGIAGWTISEYHLSRGARAFVASRVSSPSGPEKLHQGEQEHVVLYVSDSHMNGRKGTFTTNYETMIKNQYSLITDSFKKGTK